ncbi:SPJ_0845 family protein [Streptococcus hongkongensis]|nr:ABC transporter ATP-binding protein [Streptococcus uberis]
MAITHKKNDNLEKMMAGFASIPSFDKPINVDAEGKFIPASNEKEQKRMDDN